MTFLKNLITSFSVPFYLFKRDSMKAENIVTIYQNGIAAFERAFEMKADQDTLIKLPFKSSHIGDVAATLGIFGPVKVKQAPIYSPVKEKPALEINPSQANSDKASKALSISFPLCPMTAASAD